MTEKEIENILAKLLHEIGTGRKEAVNAYTELSSDYTVWKSKKTAENWADVEYRAQGAMMWIPKTKDESTDQKSN
jgi:hypothetical protein